MARHRNQRTTHRCWTCLVNVKEINFDEIAVESFRWFYRFMRFLRITKRNTRHIDITLSLISIMNGVLENTQKHFDSINRCSNTLCVVESSGANCQRNHNSPNRMRSLNKLSSATRLMLLSWRCRWLENRNKQELSQPIKMQIHFRWQFD